MGVTQSSSQSSHRSKPSGGVPVGNVHHESPPAVGFTSPDSCVFESNLAFLTISLWNADGNSAQPIAEVAGGCDLLKGDVTAGFHRPNPYARDPPELLDGSAPLNHLPVLCHELGVFRIKGGHRLGIARVEQRFKIAGELLDRFSVERRQCHNVAALFLVHLSASHNCVNFETRLPTRHILSEEA